MLYFIVGWFMSVKISMLLFVLNICWHWQHTSNTKNLFKCGNSLLLSFIHYHTGLKCHSTDFVYAYVYISYSHNREKKCSIHHTDGIPLIKVLTDMSVIEWDVICVNTAWTRVGSDWWHLITKWTYWHWFYVILVRKHNI